MCLDRSWWSGHVDVDDLPVGANGRHLGPSFLLSWLGLLVDNFFFEEFADPVCKGPVPVLSPKPKWKLKMAQYLELQLLRVF